MNAPQVHEWLSNSLVHCTVFLGLALVGERLLWRRSAARRHALLLGAALGVPLLLAAGALLPSWRLPGGGASPVSTVEATVSREIVVGPPVGKGVSKAPVSPAPPPEAPAPLTVPGILVAGWLAGIALLWLRWGAGYLVLRRLARRLAPSTAFDLLLVDECRTFGIGTTPRLLVGNARTMPMTWGFRRHRIVLPLEAAAWPVAKRRAVLRHELAHVARRDCATSSIAALCLALAWFHPFAWLLQRALRRAREAACDDLVVSGPAATDRNAYARDLIDVVATPSERPHPGVALAMGASQTRLMKRRLAAILDDSRDRSPLTRRFVLSFAPFWIAGIAVLGMTSAFRAAVEAQEAGSPRASGEIVVRTYALIDSQLRQLLDGDPDQPRAFDPEAFAAEARQNLIANFGLRIRSADPVEIDFPAKFRMEVSAPASVQDDIAWALDSMVDGDQIEVRLHVYDLDDPEWISERIGKGDELASVMTATEFANLRKDVTERGGTPKAFPKLITRVGQRAKVEMIREFIYPTEYDPPELVRFERKEVDDKGIEKKVDDKDKDNEKALEEGLGEGIVMDNTVLGVTPANPTAFNMRPVGLTWETDPTITREGAINMESIIEDTQFLGFINYGSPIRGKGQGLFRKPIVLTENRIIQPVFETERIATRITMAPESFIALRGFRPDSNPPLNVDIIDKSHPNQPALAKRTYRIYVIEAKIVPRK